MCLSLQCMLLCRSLWKRGGEEKTKAGEWAGAADACAPHGGLFVCVLYCGIWGLLVCCDLAYLILGPDLVWCHMIEEWANQGGWGTFYGAATVGCCPTRSVGLGVIDGPLKCFLIFQWGSLKTSKGKNSLGDVMHENWVPAKYRQNVDSHVLTENGFCIEMRLHSSHQAFLLMVTWQKLWRS